MSTAQTQGLCAIQAYRSACGTRPVLARRGHPESGISLYCWNLPPTRDVRIPRTREVTLAVHLGGVQQVRVYTDRGVSRRCSRPGDITLIPRDRSIHYLIEGGVAFATVHLPEQATRLFAERGGGGLLGLSDCLFAFRDDFALASVRALAHRRSGPRIDEERYAAQILDTLALHLSQRVSRGSIEPVRLAGDAGPDATPPSAGDLAALTAAIDRRLDERLSLQDLSEMAGVGRTALCQQFRQQLGTTPHQYLMSRRIEHARRLFAAGRRSVTEVSFELGFSSTAHFSNAFKRSTGLQPRQYLDAIGRRSPERRAD